MQWFCLELGAEASRRCVVQNAYPAQSSHLHTLQCKNRIYLPCLLVLVRWTCRGDGNSSHGSRVCRNHEQLALGLASIADRSKCVCTLSAGCKRFSSRGEDKNSKGLLQLLRGDGDRCPRASGGLGRSKVGPKRTALWRSGAEQGLWPQWRRPFPRRRGRPVEARKHSISRAPARRIPVGPCCEGRVSRWWRVPGSIRSNGYLYRQTHRKGRLPLCKRSHPVSPLSRRVLLSIVERGEQRQFCIQDYTTLHQRDRPALR